MANAPARVSSTRTHTTPAVDWRTRPLRPSDAVVWSVGQVRELTGGGMDFLGLLAASLILVWFFVLPSVTVAAFMVTAATLAGAVLTWTIWKGGTLGWMTTRRALALTALASNGGWLLLLALGQPRLANALAFGFWELFMRRPTKKVQDPWWSHLRMSTAFVTAGILQMVKVQGVPDSLPTIGYVGKKTETEYGTWQSFRLPPGATWEDVRARHVPLASAIGVPTRLLHIEHDEDQPANVVTIAKLVKQERQVEDAVLPERTNFTEPVPLGNDHLGRPQYLQTRDTHTAFIGKTRSGKTWLARYFVCWGLLDPRVPIWMVSGKDDPEDWQAMKALCVRYETVRDLQGVLDVLLEVEAVSEYRGDIPRADRQLAILVIDEWYRLRNRARAADPELAKKMEGLISALAATLASRNIHLVMTFQRGTVTFIDADLRASLGQKAVGMVVKDQEIRTVLDMVPLTVPRNQGDFLVTLDDSEPTLVMTPKVTDEAFIRVCEQAARLRADEPHGPVIPEQRQGADVEAVEEPEEPEEADPLQEEVWAILGRHGALQASGIFDKLPEDIRGGGAGPLGKKLNRMGGVRTRWEGSTKLYELVPGYPGTPGHPRGTLLTGGFYPRTEHPEGPEHAHGDTQPVAPPVLQVVP